MKSPLTPTLSPRQRVERGKRKNFSGRLLLKSWFFPDQEEPGGTGVPPVQAQVENLCHQVKEHREPQNFQDRSS
jgi:hypothetical protein